MSKSNTKAPVIRPYNAWIAAYAVAKTREAKVELMKKTEAGEYGDQVKHSVLGIGTFDPKHLEDVLDADCVKSMKFYAKLED